MSAPTQPAEERGPRIYPGSVVIRLDPVHVESLFKSLAEAIVVEEEVKVEPPKIVKAAFALVNEMLKEQLSTFLGQILDPRWMNEQFKDKSLRIVELLLDYYRQTARRIVERIKSKQMTGLDVEEELDKLERLELTISVAAREAIDRMFALMVSNSPADFRPPLVNVKLGFEKVRP